MSWAPTTATNNAQEISIEWVKNNLDSGKFVLVDCREQNEWDAGHIEGAQFMPLSRFDIASMSLDPNTPVVVYCRSGMRSLRATTHLLQRGYKAASMVGGFMGWNQ